MIKKVEKAISYKDKAYEEIKSAIISQHIKAGEQLNERILAEQMGLSRTPIREALSILENEGWVITEPWKGTFVLEVTEQDIEEVFQMRLALEPLAVELVISKLKDQDGAMLNELQDKQRSCMDNMDADQFICIDRDFHAYITSLAGNRRLAQVLNNLSDMMRCLGLRAMVTGEARYKEVLAEHESIINAILARDLIKARSSMSYHILRTREQVYKNAQSKVVEK